MPEKDYPYKVSASIITYNQAEYIEKAIEGAIAQEVDFPYEIIIGDDCSTDGTREILLDYKQQYPDLIKLHLHDEHYDGIPGRLNNITNIRSAQGKYIAFCDGDDYWISKDKLQKQADFMDTNPKYSFCFHDVYHLDDIINKSYYLSEYKISLRKSASFDYSYLVPELIRVPASTTFYRTHYFQPLPNWFWDVFLADRMLKLMAAQNGPFRFMKNLKAYRRLHEKGVTSYFRNSYSYKKILKNDLNIIKKNFSNHSTDPLSFKALYLVHEATVFYNQHKYYKCTKALIKAFLTDRRVVNRLWRRGISKFYFRINTFFK